MLPAEARCGTDLMTSAPLLVRLPNPVGDVVMTTPLLRCLRQQLPGTPVIAAGRPAFAALLDGLDSVDAFVPLPAAGSGAGLRGHAAALRASGARTCLLLPNSWSSALAVRLAGIQRRVGRRAAGRRWLLSHPLPPVGPARPMTRVYLEMLSGIGLPVPPAEQEPAAELVVAESPLREWLGVAPGAAFGPSKIYPLDQTVAALRQACAQTGLRPLVLGAAGEIELLESLTAQLRAQGLDAHMPAPGDLGNAKRNVAACAVLLTADSGTRHIAAALRVPQVALYGPTHPGWSAHAPELTQVLREDQVDCLGCHHKICPIDHRCMTRLAPERVAQALIELAGSSATAPPTPNPNPNPTPKPTSTPRQDD